MALVVVVLGGVGFVFEGSAQAHGGAGRWANGRDAANMLHKPHAGDSLI
jgi:hypothetical protein